MTADDESAKAKEYNKQSIRSFFIAIYPMQGFDNHVACYRTHRLRGPSTFN